MKRLKFKQIGTNLGIPAPESRNSKVTAGAAFPSLLSTTKLLSLEIILSVIKVVT